MFTVDNMRTFLTKVPKVRYKVQENKYLVTYIGENCLLSDCIQNLNIMRQDIRHIFVPKARIKNIRVTDTIEYVKEIRKQKFVVASSRNNTFIKKGFSHIYDTSIILSKLDKSLNGNYSTIKSQSLLLNYIESLSTNKEYKRVILYTVDTSKPLSIDVKKRKIYAFSKYFKENKTLKDVCDIFLFCIIGDRRTLYLKLFDSNDSVHSFVRFLNIVASVKNIPSNVTVESDKETDLFLKEVDSQVKELDVNNKKIREAISYTIQANYRLFNSISISLKEDDSAANKKRALASIVMFAVTKDSKKGEALLRLNQAIKKKPKLSEKKLGVLIKNYTKEIVVNSKIVNTNKRIFQKTPIDKIVDNKLPTTLFNKRKEDFDSQFINDIKTVAGGFANREYPLKVDSIKTELIDDSASVKQTDIKKITIKFKDEHNKTKIVKFMIPNIREDGSFLINGHKKLVVNQLILKPVFYPEKHVAKIITYYSVVQLMNTPYRGKELYHAYAGGHRLPVALMLIFQHGDAKKVLSDFGIKKYTIVDKVNKRDDKYIELANKKFIKFDNSEIMNHPESTSFYNSLKVINFKKFDFITPVTFFDGNEYKEILIKLTGNKNSPFVLKLMVDELIDPISKNILKNMGYPTTYYNLIVYVCKKILTDIVNKRNDLNNERVRNVEVLNQLLYQQLTTAYNSYYLKRKSGDVDAEVEFNEYKIFKTLVNNQLVRIKENVSPAEQLSLKTRVTYVGPGGLKVADAAGQDIKLLDNSAYGQIDPVDTPEGSMVGISQSLSNGAILTDQRGLFGIKPYSDDEASGVLGPSTSFTPFIENDEATRMIFAANQVKQAVPLKKKSIPLVQTGYESIYTNLLDGDFIKKADVAGTIVEYKENVYIKIKSNSGKIQTIDLTPVDLKSGQSVNGISEFTPVFKVGDKVKKGEIVAEGASVSSGVICQGANLLCGWTEFEGYSFEDGNTISSKLLENETFTSVHYKTIEVFLFPDSHVLKVCRKNDKFKAGDPLFVFTNSEIFEYSDLDADELIDKNINVRAPHDCTVLEVKVFPNSNINKHTKLLPIYIDFISRNKNVRVNEGNFKLRGEKFDGIMVEIHLKYEMALSKGDKLVNRHGHKGTNARIVPVEQMPVTPWGQPLDICINPTSTINRILPGQLFDTYVGLMSWKLKELMFKKSRKQFMLVFAAVLKQLDNTPGKLVRQSVLKHFNDMSSKEWESFKHIVKDKFEGIPIIIPPFKSPSVKQIETSLKLLDLKPTYSLYLPNEKIHTAPSIPVGYLYMYKLEHLAQMKLSSRSNKTYSTKTMQPPQGKSVSGGQKLGEAESWSLLSYNAKTVIRELHGSLSDDQVAKREMLQNIIETGKTNFVKSESSPTQDYVFAYLKCLLLGG